MTNFTEIRIEVLIDNNQTRVRDEIIPSKEALKLATADFNPSGDHGITLIKIVSAALIQLIIDHGTGLSSRFAMQKTQEAKMWAVQSVVDKNESEE